MAGYDGLKHIVLSVVITVGFNLFLPWYFAAIIVIIIGIVKEIYDIAGKECCEWKDFICDLIGIVIGIL